MSDILDIAGAIAVPARSAADPDGTRCSAALSAHLRVEQTRGFRRLLLPRLAAFALLWAAAATSLLPAAALWIGLALIVALALALAAAAR